MSSQLDTIHCPVCAEVYPENIYQCPRGHGLCHVCYEKCQVSKKCPTCRTPFGEIPLRNLMMESLMGELGLRMMVECPFKPDGCDKEIYSNFVKEHANSCFYNILKFGPIIDACKELDYDFCPFQINRSNIAEWIEHLREVHNVKYREKPFPTSSIETITDIEMQRRGMYVHAPTIFDFKKEGFAILIVAAERKQLTISPYILAYNADPEKIPNCEVKFTFTTTFNSRFGCKKIKMSASPVDILKIKDCGLTNFNCAVPIPILEKDAHHTRDDLVYVIDMDVEK